MSNGIKKPAFGRGGRDSSFNSNNTNFGSKHQTKTFDFGNEFRCEAEIFEDCFRLSGYDIPLSIQHDENVHRFGKKKRCWYIAGLTWGVIGDWSGNLPKVLWFKKDRQLLNPEQWKEIQSKIVAAKKEREERRLKSQKEIAEQAVKDLESFREVQSKDCHTYLQIKHVNPYGVRINQSYLVIPLQDIYGKIWSYQRIAEKRDKNGRDKWFKTGGRKQGCFHIIGTIEANKTKPIIFSEGYATAASIHEATGYPVIICFDAGNIDPVVKVFRDQYLYHSFLIAGDNDQWKGKNTGKEAAQSVASRYGCKMVLPQFKETKTHPKDFNDLHVLEGLEEVKKQIEDALNRRRLRCNNALDFLTIPLRPREMILGPIIPEQGLAMIFAKPGIGKTFLSLSIACAVVSGKEMFDGRWKAPSPRKVLFLDGEMSQVSLQERIRSISRGYGCKERDLKKLHIITPDQQEHSMPDLSTQEGQSYIEEHLEGVELLILDNLSSLCRSYKENDSDSWVLILEWLLSLRCRGISVLIIHHANKNGKQRGTSRKEDSLDTVIELKESNDKEEHNGATFELHYQKARGFYGESSKPFELTLITEEDEALAWQVNDIENILEKKVWELQQEGMSRREIAKELDISSSKAHRVIKKMEAEVLVAK